MMAELPIGIGTFKSLLDTSVPSLFLLQQGMIVECILSTKWQHVFIVKKISNRLDPSKVEIKFVQLAPGPCQHQGNSIRQGKTFREVLQ